MRTALEIQAEYTQVCAQIGQLEVQKTQTLSQLDTKLAPLHKRVEELMLENQQVQAVQTELEKQKAATATVVAEESHEPS